MMKGTDMKKIGERKRSSNIQDWRKRISSFLSLAWWWWQA
jgi:hypothetical protein